MRERSMLSLIDGEHIASHILKNKDPEEMRKLEDKLFERLVEHADLENIEAAMFPSYSQQRRRPLFCPREDLWERNKESDAFAFSDPLLCLCSVVRHLFSDKSNLSDDAHYVSLVFNCLLDCMDSDGEDISRNRTFARIIKGALKRAKHRRRLS